MERWWQLEVKEILVSLSSDLTNGLSANDAAARLQKYGPNQLKEGQKVSPLRLFMGQFDNFIVWVLVGAALVSGFLQEWVDAVAIVAIVIINAVLGFIQEYRAERSLAALRRLSSPNSKVIRDGRHAVIAACELVPGDIVELESGDHVPADSRIVWLTSNFATQEASLTGESTPVVKTSAAIEGESVPLAERANMVYMGTSVASGKARAMAACTGMQTELGKIAGMIQQIETETTPLQKKLEQFGKWIVYLCLVLVTIVFVLGVVRGGKLLDMFLTAVSLAVAAIPEGLPAVVTIALALGVQRMVKRHVLIRKLPSVETLGCTTVICSDKTGTLTKNEMTVQAVFADNLLFKVTGVGYEPKGLFMSGDNAVEAGGHAGLSKSLLCGLLCNGASLSAEGGIYKVIGDPTEGALLTLAAKAGMDRGELESQWRFVTEIPFDSQRKKMAVIRSGANGGQTAFVKGAPDIMLKDCVSIEIKGQVRDLTDKDRRDILQANDALADQAMRVLAVGYRHLGEGVDKHLPETVERELVFAGLIAMIDPPRQEVIKAIDECKTAGIRAVMITGDHKNTAVAIAKQLGVFGPDSVALTGEELDRLSDAELERDIEKIPVYARVSPEHKLRIVRAWRKLGHIVAMTGDGVNDAPAVKEADIGVAMGVTGTDVTKEVSDMVITDDNFASIVAAVEEGRGIYDNIKKFIHYLLSCNAGEVLVMFISSLVGLPVPLLPIQILWVNLVTDGLPALALGVDTIDPGIMRRPPRSTGEGVVTKQQAVLMLLQGSFIAFCSLAAFCFVYFVEAQGEGRARTAAFIVLACSQLFHAFNCRSQTESLFKIGVFTNSKLLFATGVSFLLQMVVVYVPFLQKIFKTESLGLFDWVLVVAISSLPLWAMEAVKRIKRTAYSG